jgi:membrane associated rhomboid family serine protease
MARGSPRLSDGFTFGGRIPAAVGVMIAAMVVASVLSWFPTTKGLAFYLPLSPAHVLSGELWRVVTWPLVQPHPLTLLFVGLMFWQFGAQLVFEWGERRFVARVLGITVGAGIATSLLAFVWPPASLPYAGAWPVALALLFAWGLLHSGAQLNWFGVLPMSGGTVAKVILFGTVIMGLFDGGVAGLGGYVPHLAGYGIAYLQISSRGGPSRSWRHATRRWEAWRQQRRSRHLKVVRKKEGEDDRPRWMN